VVILKWQHGVRATIERGSLVRATPEAAAPILSLLLSRFVETGGMGDPDIARANYLLDLLSGGDVVYADRPAPLIDGVE
jgi:hypothetical protein